MKKPANSWRQSFKISKILCWINFLSRIWVGRSLHGANWASQEGMSSINNWYRTEAQTVHILLKLNKRDCFGETRRNKGFWFQNLLGPVDCHAVILGAWFYGSKPTLSSWNLYYCPMVWDQVVWPISSNHGPGEALRPIHARCLRHPDLGKRSGKITKLCIYFRMWFVFFYLEILFKDF